MTVVVQLESGERITVNGRSAVIGRDPNCDIPLPREARLQSRHAVIRYIAGRWLIQSEGDWSVQSGDGLPGVKCWLKANEVIRLTQYGPRLVFMPSDLSTAATSSTDAAQGMSPETRITRNYRKYVAKISTALSASFQRLTKVPTYVQCKFAGYGLRRDLNQALIALGEKMYQSCRGDQQLIDQLVELNKKIEEPGVSVAEVRNLKESCRQLKVCLAESVMSKATCPTGVEMEYETAMAAMGEMNRNEETLSRIVNPSLGLPPLSKDETDEVGAMP